MPHQEFGLSWIQTCSGWARVQHQIWVMDHWRQRAEPDQVQEPGQQDSGPGRLDQLRQQQLRLHRDPAHRGSEECEKVPLLPRWTLHWSRLQVRHKNIVKHICLRFALKRQFPEREDPKEQLLTHLLGVAIAILVLLISAIVAAAFFLKSRASLRPDNFKFAWQKSTEDISWSMRHCLKNIKISLN